MSAGALLGASVGLSVFSGIQQYNTAKAQASAYRTMGDTQAAEANREALRIKDDAQRFAQTQKMQYIGSGVEFGGSAIVTVAQTKKWANAEAEAMRARGEASRAYSYKSGQIQEDTGRNALLGNIASSAFDVYSYYNPRKLQPIKGKAQP